LCGSTDPFLRSRHTPCKSKARLRWRLDSRSLLADVPGSNCRSEPARDGGLIGNGFFAGVHIHSCGHGGYWFRSYGESLGGAPSNQTLLPLSSGASPGLGIPSLRSCSVGPPRSAIHGRARLTRLPCRVAHCAEPALGLPKGQEDQNQKQIRSKARRPASRPDFRSARVHLWEPSLLAMAASKPIDIFLMHPDQTVGAGLPAMAA